MNRCCAFTLLYVIISGLPASASGTAGQVAVPPQELLALTEVVRMALDRAPEMSLVRARAERAEEALKETRSLNLPQVSMGTGLAYNNGFPLSIEGAAPSLFQVGVSQSIFSKKNRNLIREAEENRNAGQLETEAARNEVAARAALLYSELHQSRRLTVIWSARLERAIQDLRRVETELEIGRAKPVDVTLARIPVAGIRQQLLASEEISRLLEMELRDLTGLPDSKRFRTEAPQIASDHLCLSPEDLNRRALELNPEILQAESDLRGRELHIEAERGERHPRMELIGEYALFSRTNNYQDYFNRFTRNNFLVGLSIIVPVFDGSRASARVAQSRQELVEARLRLQRMKQELRLGIERAASALRLARGAAELAIQEENAARETLRVQESLYESGRIGSKEIEASQDQLRTKEAGRIEADTTVFRRQVELLKLTGTLADCF